MLGLFLSWFELLCTGDILSPLLSSRLVSLMIGECGETQRLITGTHFCLDPNVLVGCKNLTKLTLRSSFKVYSLSQSAESFYWISGLCVGRVEALVSILRTLSSSTSNLWDYWRNSQHSAIESHERGAECWKRSDTLWTLWVCFDSYFMVVIMVRSFLQ